MLAAAASASAWVHAETLPSAAPGAPTAITLADVNIVDVRSGRVLPRRTVVIAGGRIVSIRAAEQAPGPESNIVSGAGKYLLPGLWDMHVHLTHPHYFDLFVANGVLGVRDMGGGADAPTDGCESVKASQLQQWRGEIQRKSRLGPDIILSGPALSGTSGPRTLRVHTPDDARAAVAAVKQQGADFIKVYDAIPLPAFTAFASAAKRSGLDFAGHVPDEVGPLRALQLGQRSIEHVRDAMLVCFTDDPRTLETFFRRDGWRKADRKWGRKAHQDCAPTIAALARGQSWFTPTLVVEKAKVNVEDRRFREDPRRASLPAPVREGLAEYSRRKLAQSVADRSSELLWWTLQQRLVKRLGDANASILAGTDSACEGGLPGFSLHDELAELVAAGLSPAKALQAATLEPARYLRRPGEGEIRPGFRANLVVLDANPLDDIHNTRRISAVILDGKMIGRAELDRLLRR